MLNYDAMEKENRPLNHSETPKRPLMAVLAGKQDGRKIEIIGDCIYSAKKSTTRPLSEEVGYHQVNMKVFEVRLYDSYITEDSIIATQIAVGSSNSQGKLNEKTIYPSKFTPIYSFNDTVYLKNKKNDDATAFHFTDPLYSTCSFNVKAKYNDITTTIIISNSKGIARNDTIGTFTMLYKHKNSSLDSSLIRWYPVYDVENENKIIGEIRLKVEYVLDIDFFDDSASESATSRVTTPSTIRSSIRFDSRSPLSTVKAPKNGLSPRNGMSPSPSVLFTPKSTSQGIVNIVATNTATLDIATSPMSPYVPTPLVSPDSTKTTPYSTKFGNKNMFISPPIKEKKQKIMKINILRPIKKNLRTVLFVALPLLIFLIKILFIISLTSAAPSSMARYREMYTDATRPDAAHHEREESSDGVKFFDKLQLKKVYRLLQDEEIMNN